MKIPFSSFAKSFHKAKQYEAEAERATDEAVLNIKKDSALYIEKSKEISGQNQAKADKIAQKLKFALEENDMESVDSQLDKMMALLDEDNDSKIKQKVADEKLKSAAVEDVKNSQTEASI